MNRIAVVTAVTGGYDRPIKHTAAYRDDVDYLYFTDGQSSPADSEWQVCRLPEGITGDLRKLAKIPKLNPHMIPALCEYDYVIWVDGSMQIVNDNFVEEVLSFLYRGLVLSPHWDDRDCGYDEAEVLIGTGYYDQDFEGQCDSYKKEGFPEHYGLYAAGVQARDMNVPKVKFFGEIWFREVLDWTSRDQVSCGYALWKSGLVPDVLDESFDKYGWVCINAH